MRLHATASLAMRAGEDHPATALRGLLDELAALVAGLDADVYGARFPADASGSIGEHVRHCLDHVGALLAAGPTAIVNYDKRERGTPAESDPAAASRQIVRLSAALERWASRSTDEPVQLELLVSRDTKPIETWSTLGRELAFVISHTIHHQALIAVLLAVHGCDVPARFGCAPSTPRRS